MIRNSKGDKESEEKKISNKKIHVMKKKFKK